jgi:GAF domain-containing protein
VTTLAVETVPGADASGVTLVDDRGHKTTAAATDPLTERADDLQYQLDEGPCLTSWARRTLVRIDDLRTDRRWPRWEGAAQELGLRSTLSTPLAAGDRAFGALKVYSREPAAFDAHAERVLTLFADQAAILVANVVAHDRAQRLSEDLRSTLRTRDLVSTARGVLIGRERVDEHTAFVLLAGAAQREGRTLEEAARSVLETALRRRR